MSTDSALLFLHAGTLLNFTYENMGVTARKNKKQAFGPFSCSRMWDHREHWPVRLSDQFFGISQAPGFSNMLL